MNPAAPTILLVDDEVAILKSFACFFEDCGYRVLTARDGHEGLAVFSVITRNSSSPICACRAWTAWNSWARSRG